MKYSIKILPLEGKYYHTKMLVKNSLGKEVGIRLFTDYPNKPSCREYARDEDIEEYYDNHTEDHNTYEVARIIKIAVERYLSTYDELLEEF